MKKTCLAVLIFLTVGMLGCGNSQELLNEETVNNENSSGKVHVEFMQGKPESVEAYEKVIQIFEEQNNTIDVEQVNLPDTYTRL